MPQNALRRAIACLTLLLLPNVAAVAFDVPPPTPVALPVTVAQAPAPDWQPVAAYEQSTYLMPAPPAPAVARPAAAPATVRPPTKRTRSRTQAASRPKPTRSTQPAEPAQGTSSASTKRGASCPAPPSVSAGPALGARAIVAEVPVHSSPGGPVTRSLANPTSRENMPLYFGVLRTSGNDWLQVLISERPNGSNGWIWAKHVETFALPYRVQVELCARRLTVYDLGTPVMIEPVAVGKPDTPTPRGRAFIDYVVREDANGPYGPWLLSISLFSDAVQNFGGGIGQIALHGTNRPDKIGTAASSGCVRLHNATITQLERILAPGTPVTIVA